MKTLKYLTVICFAVYIDLLYAKISPLNNQTSLTSGSHGLRITNYGQSYIYSGSWTHLFMIKFPDNLYQNISIPMVLIGCHFSPGFFNQSNQVCERYKKMMEPITIATNDFSHTYRRKFQNLLKQQTVNSWIFPLLDRLLALFSAQHLKVVNDSETFITLSIKD